jgi:hypothetical protein
VRHILQFCDLSQLTEQEDDDDGMKSPKEGKFSVKLNNYLSFLHRNHQLREIDSFITQIFEERQFFDVETFVHMNRNVSSEMFCTLMALLYQNMPCTKSIQRLRKKFMDSKGIATGSASPKTGIASPKNMQNINKIV